MFLCLLQIRYSSNPFKCMCMFFGMCACVCMCMSSESNRSLILNSLRVALWLESPKEETSKKLFIKITKGHSERYG